MKFVSNFVFLALFAVTPVSVFAQSEEDFEEALEELDQALGEAVDELFGDEEDAPAPKRSASTAAASQGVTVVLFDGGSFAQTDSKTWKEFSKDNVAKFTFQEVTRKGNSIFIDDKSRDFQVELDVAQRKIRVSETGKKTFRDLYNISSVLKGPNGFLLSAVSFAGGWFQNTGGKNWAEKGSDGRVKFNFTETLRTKDSVYLHDASRKMNIQLDVGSLNIRVANGNETLKNLYKITGAK